MIPFTSKTFRYFDAASRHASDRAWFVEHRKSYQTHVSLPFADLLAQLREACAPALPGFDFSERRIKKPVRRQMAGEEGPCVRTNSMVSICEPGTSMFETNPGIYISLGKAVDDNVCAVGLYQLSSRQIKRLRPAFLADAEHVDAILRAPKLKRRWGGLAGARYTRYPKEFPENAPGATYLWHKQVYLARHFSREEAESATFSRDLVADVEVALPFLQWMRTTVGVYKRPRVEA